MNNPAGPGRLAALTQNLIIPEAPASAPTPGALTNEALGRLKQWLIARVAASFDNPAAIRNNDTTRHEVEARLAEAIASARLVIPESLKAELQRDILNEFSALDRSSRCWMTPR